MLQQVDLQIDTDNPTLVDQLWNRFRKSVLKGATDGEKLSVLRNTYHAGFADLFFIMRFIKEQAEKDPTKRDECVTQTMMLFALIGPEIDKWYASLPRKQEEREDGFAI